MPWARKGGRTTPFRFHNLTLKTGIFGKPEDQTGSRPMFRVKDSILLFLLLVCLLGDYDA